MFVLVFVLVSFVGLSAMSQCLHTWARRYPIFMQTTARMEKMYQTPKQ